jgi:hypothetical protein
MGNLDHIALESASLDRNPERSCWLDRETGNVLVADPWSKEQAYKLDGCNRSYLPALLYRGTSLYRGER